MPNSYMKLWVIPFAALIIGGCSTAVVKEENASLIQAHEQDQQTLRDYADKLRAVSERSEKERARSEAEMAALRHELKTALQEKQVAVKRLEDFTVIEVGQDLLFESGQVDMTAQGKAIVAEIATALGKYPSYHMRIEGHTDSMPLNDRLKQRYRSNWELSAIRAATVVRYMIYGLQVPGKNLSIAGYADHRPVATNETKEGRAQNRRIRAVIFKP